MHILIGTLLDPLQFACRPNKSIHDVISLALHYMQVWLGKHKSDNWTPNPGVPQGCVLLPLFSLYTTDCVSMEPTVKILKFADDITMVACVTY